MVFAQERRLVQPVFDGVPCGAGAFTGEKGRLLQGAGLLEKAAVQGAAGFAGMPP